MTYEDLSKAERVHAKHLEPYIDIVQKFVDDNITEGVAMPAKVVYAELASQVQLSEKDFIASFRVNVRCGRISGIEGARRWGYRCIGDGPITHAYTNGEMKPIAAHNGKKTKLEPEPEPEEPEPEEPEEPESEPEPELYPEHTKTVLYLTKFYRLVGLDRYQWALQKRSGESSWQNRGYWSSLQDALRAVARKMLNDEIKAAAETITDLKDLARVVRDAEHRLNEKYREGYELQRTS
jgi:hypothetical protein